MITRNKEYIIPLIKFKIFGIISSFFNSKQTGIKRKIIPIIAMIKEKY